MEICGFGYEYYIFNIYISVYNLDTYVLSRVFIQGVICLNLRVIKWLFICSIGFDEYKCIGIEFD